MYSGRSIFFVAALLGLALQVCRLPEAGLQVIHPAPGLLDLEVSFLDGRLTCHPESLQQDLRVVFQRFEDFGRWRHPARRDPPGSRRLLRGGCGPRWWRQIGCGGCPSVCILFSYLYLLLAKLRIKHLVGLLYRLNVFFGRPIADLFCVLSLFRFPRLKLRKIEILNP